MISVSYIWIGESLFVVAKGILDRLGHPGELYVTATAPTKTTPNETRTQRLHTSAPIAVHADGSWETRLEIDPSELRELTVRAVLMPPCDIKSLDNPLCGAPSQLDSGSHPEDPEDIPTHSGPSTPGNPDNPRLGPSRVPVPVVPPGITGPGGIPQVAEPVVPRHAEKLDAEQWLERDGSKVQTR